MKGKKSFIIAAALAMLLASSAGSRSQGPAGGESKGLSTAVLYESAVSQPDERSGRYKLRVTEFKLEPGGYMSESGQAGHGIRFIVSGYMTYALPDRTVVWGPGDYFYESEDVDHTVYNRTDSPMVHLLFEVLPAD